MASLSSPIGSTIDVAARTVSSSAIRGGAGGGIPGGGGTPTIQPQSNLINVEKNLQVQIAQNVQQTQEISALRSAIDSLRIETTTLNQGLVSISNLIQQDSAVEKQQEAEKAENERKLAETNIRLGKESQLEQNITNSLVTPVQALQQKVGNIFGRIGEALTTLFFGWLTNQGIEALEAESEGNKEKLEEIKNNVLKTIGFGVAGIGAIKIGFDLIIKTITGITGKIGSILLKLATAPLKVLRSTLQAAPIIGGLFGGPKPGAKPGPKPTGGGGMLSGVKNALKGLAGPLLAGTALTGFDIAQGEDPARAIAGATTGMIGSAGAFALGSLIPIPGTGVGAGALAYGPSADFGKEMYDKFFGKSETPQAKVAEPTTPKAGNSKPEPPPTIMAPVEADAKISPSTVEPQNSMMSDSGTSASTATTSPAPAVVQPQTPIIPPPSPEMTKNFQAAWDNRNRGYARGRIESAWNNMTVEQQQQAKEWAKSTGKDWTEMKLVEKPSTVQAVPLPSAQVQPLPKPTQNVGELSEPAPNVVMMPSGQSNNQQSSISQAPTNGTDTPLISSSNPDNFYVLYSQLNYNVVM